jgi:chromosome segregation ATPase
LEPDGQLTSAPAAEPAAPPGAPNADPAPELEALRQRTATLEQDLEQLRAELTAATAQRDELAVQVHSKEEELTRQQEQNQDVLLQLAQARQEAERAGATGKREDLVLQLQKQEEELAREREQNKDTLLQLAQARQEAIEAAELLRNHEAGRSEYDGVHQQLAALQERVARAGELEAELNTARAEIARLESERTETEAASRRQSEQAVKDLADARSECARLQSHAEQMRGHLETHTAARGHLDQQLEAVRKESQDTWRRIKALSQEVDAARSEKAHAEERWQNESAAAKEHKAQVQSLERRLDELTGELEGARAASAQALSEARGAWDSELSTHRSQWDEVRQKLAAEAEERLREARSASTQALSEARGTWDSELSTHRSQWEEDRQKLTAEAEERLREEQTRTAALHGEIEQARRQTTQLQEERDTVVQQLRKRLATHDHLAVDLQKIREKRDADVRALERTTSHIAALQAECVKSRQGEAEARSRWQALEAELRSVRNKHSEAERCLSEARSAVDKQATSDQEGYEQHLALLREAFELERQKLDARLKRQKEEIEALKSTLEMIGIVV